MSTGIWSDIRSGSPRQLCTIGTWHYISIGTYLHVENEENWEDNQCCHSISLWRLGRKHIYDGSWGIQRVFKERI